MTLLSDDRRMHQKQNDPEVTVGRMRCLNALGEWEALAGLSNAVWLQASPQLKHSISPYAASAATGLGRWSDLARYIPSLNHASIDYAWFSALSATFQNQNQVVSKHIALARELIGRELVTLIGESYVYVSFSSIH